MLGERFWWPRRPHPASTTDRPRESTGDRFGDSDLVAAGRVPDPASVD